ncbi:MAG: hypothetical protein ACRD4Y_18310 [Candidatus Acidiferrales bacterium]
MQFEDKILAALRKVIFPFCAVLAVIAASGAVRADSMPFDLAGPSVYVKVSRNGNSLPISSVPNLQAGDRLWIQADFPASQSARYLLIVAFLQGPTNPPPENWFSRIETWTKEVREEGNVVTVPQDAQQALLFLAPDTGGAFTTLRSTVRGKPGVFVRASEDLVQASLDRARIDKFLEEIAKSDGADSDPLTERVALLSRALAMKADPECFNKPASERSSCLTQDTDRLTLDETNNDSLVATLTSGASADLVGTLSTTPLAAKGYYSPYVGSAMDLVRLLNGLHTAELQYLPALALPKLDELRLRLNSPPSFHNPRSVLVVGLPDVKPATLPVLRPVDPKRVYCMQNTSLVLPADGAPLVFATGIAHDFAVHLRGKSGGSIDLPATADAARGGFAVDTRSLRSGEFDAETTGELHGYWGFDSYTGPAFRLRAAQPAHWAIPKSDADGLLAGREDALRLDSGSAVCVQKVSASDAKGKDLDVTWKLLKPDELEVKLPLQNEPPGPVSLQVKQFGLSSADKVPAKAYSEAAQLDGFAIRSGDRQGILTGTRLDEVSGLELNGIHFVPAKVTHEKQEETLTLLAPSSESTAALPTGEEVTAHVALKDGRALDLQTEVEPPRPRVTLVSKSAGQASGAPGFRVGNQNELPQNGRLSFLLKTEVPDKFPHDEQIEVATLDGSADALLSLSNGGLVLQDAGSVLAIVEPLKNFGPSAFGPLQFRPVNKDGGSGDWQPLAELVRIPTLKEVRCPDAPDQQCTLSGSNLFLLDAVSSDSEFKKEVTVPTGYADSVLNVPRPVGTLLYLKLRDDPSTVDTVTLPVLPVGY